MFYVFYLVDANSKTRQVEGKKNANESQRQLCQQEVVRALPVQRWSRERLDQRFRMSSLVNFNMESYSSLCNAHTYYVGMNVMYK